MRYIDGYKQAIKDFINSDYNPENNNKDERNKNY